MVVNEFNRAISDGMGLVGSSISNNIPVFAKELDLMLLKRLREEIVTLDPNSKSFRKKLRNIKRIENRVKRLEAELGHTTKSLKY